MSNNDEKTVFSLVSTVASQVLLFFLIFGMAATVDIASMRKQMKNRRAILTGISLQFVILPLLGFASVTLFKMPPPTGIALLVVTSSPGGSYSNWWCSIFNAELSLSITMTAVSTILSVIFLPLNLTIYASTTYAGQRNEDGRTILQSLDFVSLGISLAVVIGAIALGLASAVVIGSPKFRKSANIAGNISGILFITLAILLGIVGDGATKNEDGSMGAGNPFSGTKDQLIALFIGVSIPCVVGLVLANLVTAWCVPLSKPERVTCAVECTYQNTAIAVAFCISMFRGEDLQQAIRVPLWYSILTAVVVVLYLIVAWKAGWTKAPKDENLCVVIGTSYEVLEQKEENGVLVTVNGNIELVVPNGSTG